VSDYLEYGPTPYEENPEEVGTATYDPIKARAECKRTIALLRQIFGPEPEGARLRKGSNPHDFGTYYDVRCHYNANSAEAVAYAYAIESDFPDTWDDTRVRNWRQDTATPASSAQ
jgi:hypothetical protein